MGLKAVFNKLLLGKAFPQEYICTPYAELTDTRAFVNTPKGALDVSHTHILLGYKPVLIGFPADIALGDSLTLQFYCNNKPAYILGTLSLIYIATIAGELRVYKAIEGDTFLLPGFQKALSNLYTDYKSDKKHELYLSPSVYEHVRAAYIFPRKIKLVIVEKEGMYNVFPTDLNGEVGDNKYAISLRTTGRANNQLSKADHILLCEMDVNRCKQVYALGKNHMQEYKDEANFDFATQASGISNMPVYNGTMSYRELEYVESLPQGLHNLNLLKGLPVQRFTQAGILSHVCERYASWRVRRRLPFSAYLR